MPSILLHMFKHAMFFATKKRISCIDYFRLCVMISLLEVATHGCTHFFPCHMY